MYGVDMLAQLLQHMHDEHGGGRGGGGGGDSSILSRDLNQTSEQEAALQMDSLMNIMRRRSEDSKSFVRKSSVQVLASPS
eukprot:300066-Hanusia_phi.AAC.1